MDEKEFKILKSEARNSLIVVLSLGFSVMVFVILIVGLAAS